MEPQQETQITVHFGATDFGCRRARNDDDVTWLEEVLVMTKKLAHHPFDPVAHDGVADLSASGDAQTWLCCTGHGRKHHKGRSRSPLANPLGTQELGPLAQAT